MQNRLQQIALFLSVLTVSLFGAASGLGGQSKAPQLPPAVVSTAAVTTGSP
jgi:hypothetical protein